MLAWPANWEMVMTMQEPEIEEVLGRARDLIEANTFTLEDEIFVYLEIIGGLAKHVTRAQFDTVMVDALHVSHESLVYVHQDEENGDWYE